MRSPRIPVDLADQLDQLKAAIDAVDHPPTAFQHEQAAELRRQALARVRGRRQRHDVLAVAQLHATLAVCAHLDGIRTLLEDLHEEVIPKRGGE